MTDRSSDLAGLQAIDLDAGEVFSGQPSGRTIKGFAKPSLHTPAVDPL